MSNNRPNIFVLGPSGTGKTPLSDRLAKTFGMTRISGSEWVRSQIVFERPLTREEQIEQLTRFSEVELARNPNACIDFIQKKYDLDAGGFIIEGLRNPRDFSILFRPDVDFVIFLDYTNNPIVPSRFEKSGLMNIKNFVEWLTERRMMNDQAIVCQFAQFRSENPAQTRVNDCCGFLPSIQAENLDKVMEFCINLLGNIVAK